MRKKGREAPEVLRGVGGREELGVLNPSIIELVIHDEHKDICWCLVMSRENRAQRRSPVFLDSGAMPAHTCYAAHNHG